MHSCPRMHSAAHIRGKPAWIDGQFRQLGFSSKLRGYILSVFIRGGGGVFGTAWAFLGMPKLTLWGLRFVAAPYWTVLHAIHQVIRYVSIAHSPQGKG